MSQTALARGTIEYVNTSAGCGFIATEDVEMEVMFLQGDVDDLDIEVGQEVAFEIEKTTDGPRARNLQRS